uniref:Acetylajmalan esterase-like isoform X1 n=1 Tax=Nicotiana tabacum TaxID=4097 RepID=A0A1S3ZEG2_TOBAC|nr:PREDICTED: acetylajmalan esterase-like isoform X1 [Nicotiana tabacum]
MALIIRSVLHLLVISLISFVVLQQESDAEEVLMLQKPRLINCKFDKIYQLGDSFADTGNCIRERICGAHTVCGRFPYGMNFFQNATGRCSNGMLMIDFIALESGLPLLNPIKDQNANFRHGANFAVAGATALPSEILENMKMVNPSTNSSLSVQLDWMSSHFETTCYTDCPEKLNKSLFLVGEIGGNECTHGLLEGKTIEESRRMVPEVVEAIIHGVRLDLEGSQILNVQFDLLVTKEKQYYLKQHLSLYRL